MEKLQQEIDTLLAMAAAQTILISSLIRTHPAYPAFQIDLAGLTEVFLNGPAGQVLTESQCAQVRSYVETTAGLHAAQPSPAEVLIERFQRGSSD